MTTYKNGLITDTTPRSALDSWGQAPEPAPATTVVGALASGRRATLEALRSRLAAILDGTAGHRMHCECECGTVWDAGKVAPIARELREIVRELDDLPTESGGSELERIQSEREERRRQAEAEAARGSGE